LWAITSGKNSLNAHLVLNDGACPAQDVLKAANDMLSTRFGITHTTVQVETDGCQSADSADTSCIMTRLGEGDSLALDTHDHGHDHGYGHGGHDHSNTPPY
jgi:hypothetical protein